MRLEVRKRVRFDYGLWPYPGCGQVQAEDKSENGVPSCSVIKMMKRAIKEVFESVFHFQTTAVRLGMNSLSPFLYVGVCYSVKWTNKMNVPLIHS